MIRKYYLLFIAIIFALPAYAQQKASDNYVDEATAIARLKILTERSAGRISFSVDAAGNIMAAAGTEALFDSLLSRMKGASARTVVQADQYGSGIPDNAYDSPQPGGDDQPADSTGHTAGSTALPQASNPIAANFAANINPLNSEKIKEEVKCLFFLMYEQESQDIIKVKNFPAHFVYLGEILDAANSFFATQTNTRTAQAGEEMGTAQLKDIQSQIIYGITSFAISRAKEEILEAHLNAIFDKMEKDSIISALLPNTLEKIKAFRNDNSVSLIKYGGLWKAAFQEDLRNFPLTLQNEAFVTYVLNKAQLQDPSRKELAAVISGGSRVVYNLYLKKNIAQIFSDMSSDYLAEDGDNVAVFKRCVLMADVMATALGSLDNNTYKLVNIGNLKSLDDTGWALFVKLVYLRHKAALARIFDDRADSFITLATDGENNFQKIKNLVSKSINLYNSYAGILSPKTGMGTSLSLEDVRRMYDIQVQFLDNSIDYLKLFSSNGNIKQVVSAYTDYCKPVLSDISHIGEGLYNQQYGSVLDGTLDILNRVYKMKCPQPDSVCLPGFRESIDYLTKYGSFMINIIEATNSDEVAAALEEMIPKGQYKLKNAKTFSTTLSLYPGGFYGTERILKTSTPGTPGAAQVSSWKSSLSFYLPIGIDFNWGISFPGKIGKKGSNMSVGIFLQAVDLGAVLNYRLNADADEATNPEISFKQLLSPGASLIIHLPNSPIVVGGGVNYTPSLRKITDGPDLSYDANALRVGAFIAVDVTALPLFSTGKPKNLYR